MREGTKPPRICFALPYFPKYFPAGAEIQSYFIARHMLAKGWSVHFTTEDCGQPTGRLHNEDGIWVHKLKRTRLFNPVRCWRFYRSLLRINADIYYQRGATEYTYVTSLAARAVGGRLVWATSSSLDCEVDKFRRSLADEGVRGVKRAVLWLDARVRDAMISLGRKKADVIVVQTESQRARMKNRLGEESTVIKTGHPIPEKAVVKQSPPLIVWIANIKRLKRPELFLALAGECRNVQGKFLLVGGRVKPSYWRRLKKLSRNLSNLKMTGQVPFSRTNELLTAASLLVNTSTREGFPNTFVQAWLRGTPVVSLAVDPDGVLKREGIGIRSGSFPQMVEDVRRLLADERLRREMGDRASAYATKEHNLADKLKQYARLFESLYDEGRLV